MFLRQQQSSIFVKLANILSVCTCNNGFVGALLGLCFESLSDPLLIRILHTFFDYLL